jgi:hypothetical protein
MNTFWKTLLSLVVLFVIFLLWVGHIWFRMSGKIESMHPRKLQV